MANNISSRQYEILNLLLKNREGLSIDEIANALSLSRNAIQQHFLLLKKDCYIKEGVLKKTAGRPVRTFVLTEAGLHCFPKQYAWFSELILTDLKDEMGSEAFTRYMKKLGTTLSQNLLPNFEGKKTETRIDELMSVLESLGFQATASKSSTDNYEIKACNCVYHNLAQKHQEICEFDTTLISTLLDKKVNMVECMAKGGNYCHFLISNHKDA